VFFLGITSGHGNPVCASDPLIFRVLPIEDYEREPVPVSFISGEIPMQQIIRYHILMFF
jgi:hypothetical protein